MTTPLIRSLRRAWPQCRDRCPGLCQYRGNLARQPGCRRVITMPNGQRLSESAQLFAALWRHYDIAVSTQSGDRPTFFAFAAAPFPCRRDVTDDDPWLARVLKALRPASKRSWPQTNFIVSSRCCVLPMSLDVPRIADLVCPAASPRREIVDQQLCFGPCNADVRLQGMDARRMAQRSPPACTARPAVIAIGGPGDTERRYL